MVLVIFFVGLATRNCWKLGRKYCVWCCFHRFYASFGLKKNTHKLFTGSYLIQMCFYDLTWKLWLNSKAASTLAHHPGPCYQQQLHNAVLLLLFYDNLQALWRTGLAIHTILPHNANFLNYKVAFVLVATRRWTQSTVAKPMIYDPWEWLRPTGWLSVRL